MLQSGRSVKRLRVIERYLALAVRLGAAAAVVALMAAGAYFYQAGQTRAVKRLADKNLTLANENLALARQSRERLARWNVGSGLRLLEAGDSLGSLPWFAEALKADAGDNARESVDRVRLAAVIGQSPRLIQHWSHETAFSPGTSADNPSGIEISADRRQIAFSTSVNTVEVLNLATGKLSPPLRHRAFVEHTAFSPDGLRVMTCGEDGKARIWNAQTGKLLLPPIDAGFELQFCEFSPDGRLVVTAGGEGKPQEGRARVWDALTGRAITPVMTHAGNVWMARFSPDGRFIVTASGNEDEQGMGEARVWNVVTGEPVTPVLRENWQVSSACFSPDGRRVVTASTTREEGQARIWDARTGEPVCPPLKSSGPVFGVRFSPDGSRVLTRGGGGARLWNAETGELVTQPQGEYAPFGGAGIAFNPDGCSFLTFTHNSILARVWDAANGKELSPPPSHLENLEAAEFSLDGRLLITATKSAVDRWDLAPATETGPVFEHPQPVNRARFSPDGSSREAWTGRRGCGTRQQVNR